MNRHLAAARNTLLLMVFIDIAAYSIILPLIPELMEFYLARYFHAGRSSLAVGTLSLSMDDLSVILGGMLTSLWALLQFFSAPLWGRLSDRVGRRRVLLFCALCLSGAHVIWGFASTLPLFVLYRVLGGIMGGNISAANAAMADITAPEERTRAMGLLGAAQGFGMILGPVISGALGHPAVRGALPSMPGMHPFSLCAFVSALLFALNALFIARMPETLERRGTEEAREYGQIRLAAGANPRGFGLLWSLNFIFCFSLAGIELLLPFFLKQRHSLDPPSIGLVFLYIGTVMAVSQVFLIPLFMRLMHERGLIIAGFALVPLPLIMAVMGTGTLFPAMAWILPVAVGASLVSPPLVAAASHLAPPERQGHLLGIFNSWGALAYATGPLLVAAFYGVAGLDATVSLLAVLFCVGAVITGGMGRRGALRHS
ncbi:MAG: MFS transporter [Spirochaetes bacterium]|nr:MFS transporter [Spirochaetota bacterium]